MKDMKIRVYDEKEGKYWDDNVVLGVGGEFTFYDVKWIFTQIVELYTGLLDRKGKEIYEGDIGYIGSIIAPANGECKCEVVFGNGAFYLKGINEERIWWMQELERNKFYFQKIGNIHENPKLLKNK